MPDARRFLTADERLKELQRDRKALRRERMIREVASPVWAVRRPGRTNVPEKGVSNGIA